MSKLRSWSARTFFDYATEREAIRLRRAAGRPRELWTEDPIFREFRFCNIFREDDRTTLWFSSRFREPHRMDVEVLLGTIIFRWFNRISTGEILLNEHLLIDWDAEKARKALVEVKPLVTGAYIIKTPNGLNKLDGVISCCQTAWDQRADLQDSIYCASTLETAHRELMNLPFLGSFMAYELVTDLAHTCYLDLAEDLDTWAAVGPGAARGLGRLTANDPSKFSYTSVKSQRAMLEIMRELLECSRLKEYWRWQGRRWRMREVEHTLCEFDKYERTRLGQGQPKQRFEPCM